MTLSTTALSESPLSADAESSQPSAGAATICLTEMRPAVVMLVEHVVAVELTEMRPAVVVLREVVRCGC
jgi:hypothetical protein